LMISARRAVSPLEGALSACLRLVGTNSRRAERLVDVLRAKNSPLYAYLNRRKLFTSDNIRQMVPALAVANEGWISGVDHSVIARMDNMLEKTELLDAVSLFEIEFYMGQMLLRDSDVMGMANGLEIRVPFLDSEFARRALAFGAEARGAP